MAFTGGMPRANYGDRHTVSVVHGASHVVFDFSSRVIDIVLVCQPTDNDGMSNHVTSDGNRLHN